MMLLIDVWDKLYPRGLSDTHTQPNAKLIQYE